MPMNTVHADAIAEFADRIQGHIRTPGSAGYAEEISVFNHSVRHSPAVAVGAESTSDVVNAVQLARRAGLNIAVLNTGHGPSLPAGDDTLLVNTSRMRGITVDATRRTAHF